ncbi:MAG: two-component regulator propeller domain-containing protein [Bacteroidia bacterium]
MNKRIKNNPLSFYLNLLFLAIFLLSSFLSSAQQQNIIFQKLTIKNGLAHDNINVVYRDRFGFLWIGTGTGLQQYDGYNFITYRTNKSDSNSISKNIVYSIFEDSKGRIWFGTDGGGLNLFDRATSKFSRFDNYINKTVDSWALIISEITEDKNGILWLATFNGLFSFDPDLKKFNRFMPNTTKTESISSNFIHSVSMDDNNRLIVTTKNGINIYDQKSKIFYNYMNNPADLLLFNSMSVTSYFQENDSVSWFGTPDGKLFKYNFFNNTITEKTYYFKMKSISGYEWFSYFKDLSDNLWISSIGNALIKINLSSEEITRFKNNILETGSISSNNINKMFVDRDSTFWIGTTAGLNYFNLQRQVFNVINYNDVYDNNPSLALASVSRDQHGNYWAATLGNGLYLLDEKYKAIKNFNLGFNKDARFEGDRIISAFSDKNNFLWLGTQRNIIKFNTTAYTYEFLNKPNENIGGESSGAVGFAMDNEGKLWIAPFTGPVLVIDKNNIIREFEYSSAGQGNLKINRVNCIFCDSRNRIWIGTKENGVFVWNQNNRTIKNYKYEPDKKSGVQSNTIYEFFESSDKTIWIRTTEGGLHKFIEEDGSFLFYSVANGIPDDEVSTLIEDQDKNIWCTTKNGIFKWNPATEIVRIFDINDGLPTNDYSSFESILTNNNELLFISSYNIIICNTSNISSVDIASPVTITSIKANDRMLFIPDLGLGNPKIELNYKDKYFNIEFIAPEFLNPGKIKYSYQLEGLNSGWIECGYSHNASFSNLEGGDYVFKVRCSNAEGTWNKQITKLQIKANPHFTKTTWFRITGTGTSALLILLLFRFRVRTLRKQKKQLEKAVELRTQQFKAEAERAERSEKYKEEFLANMSHEIRTPMNAVVGLTNLLLKTELQEKQKKYLNAIRDSSDNLLVIINDILDLSKIEAGKFEIENIRFSIAKVVNHVKDILRHKAQEKGLGFVVDISSAVPQFVTGDPTRLNQVLLNLTGNALKFTESGKITIRVIVNSLHQQKANLLFSVIDTGIGIPHDKLEHIFESFTQASSDTNRKYGGSGLGLSISKRLVEMQDGKIYAESTPGVGSVFSFEIAYPVSEEIVISESGKSTDKINHIEFDNLKVLVVEDNYFNQMVVIDTLHSFNSKMQIDVAENGKTAIEKIKSNNYHVVLMDIQMPEMDGYQATEIIRSDENMRIKNIPVIAMTANATTSEVERCMKAGFNEYVSKPFNPDELFEKILKIKRPESFLN